MELTQEQLDKIASDAATKAANTVKTEMTAEMDKRDNARAAETKRIAGFTTLKSKFPEMSAMIDDEQKKENAQADLDFGLKVAEADKARLEAADKLKKDADNAQGNLGNDGDAGQGTDESGNTLCGLLGVETQKGAK